MRYKVLGKTGLFVSEMSLGTMTFGNSPGKYAAASGVSQEQANDIVKVAFDAGVNLIDTANVYAHGQSEEIVGRSIKELGINRHEIHIATKAEHATGAGPNDGGATRFHLMDQVQKSLKRLGTDYIDLYQLHGWDPATPVEETIHALNDMVRQGYIRAFGVCNWSAWQVAKAQGAAEILKANRFQSVQAYYSLVGRELEREITPMLESVELGLLVFSPLAGGYLTGKYQDQNNAGRRTTIQFPPVEESKGVMVLNEMRLISEERNISMEALALAWLRHQSVVTSVIMGVKTVDQLRSNLSATEIDLSPEELNRLDKASAITMEYPGWMFAGPDAARKDLLKTGRIQNRY